MQLLLDSIASNLIIGFALIMALDFISGLVHLYCTSALAPSAENQPEQTPAPQIESPMLTVSTQLDPQQQEIPGWSFIKPIVGEVATLSWIKQNMPPTEIWSTEIPDAITLCQARQAQLEPVAWATHQQLVSAGIRKCKKLASSLHIRRYNTMRLAELVEVLEGKVTVAELAA